MCVMQYSRSKNLDTSKRLRVTSWNHTGTYLRDLVYVRFWSDGKTKQKYKEAWVSVQWQAVLTAEDL